MINRRYLRIKVFQALYGFFKDESALRDIARKNLITNLSKTYELFLFNLAFLFEWKFFIENELHAQKNKYFPSESLTNLLTSILNNKVLDAITNSQEVKEQINKVIPRWQNSQENIRQIFNEIRYHKLLVEYANLTNKDFKSDKEFIIGLFELLTAENDLYNSIMDEQFINWEDDMVVVLSSIQKTIGSIKPNNKLILPGFHKDEEEDIKFVTDLFNLTIEHNNYLTELIISKTENWDEDRIAFVDNLLMKMALCEILYFPYVPVKVSINEYLELAKLYSTNSSHSFINGVLDKVQLELKRQNKITKLGRGLVE
ncbi:MAG: transcription antitermination factor NusB [Bacteroidia bacterium]